MSFDALTIAGIVACILSGGFLIALVASNDRSDDKPTRHPSYE